MMFRSSIELDSLAERVTRRSIHALAVAQAAAVAIGLLWYVLSVATGLIFHFMPAAPFLAATFAFRRSTGNRQAGWTEAVAIVVGGLLLVAAGLVAIGAGGGTFDVSVFVAAVIAAGAAIALIWLRRADAQAPSDTRPQ